MGGSVSDISRHEWSGEGDCAEGYNQAVYNRLRLPHTHTHTQTCTHTRYCCWDKNVKGGRQMCLLGEHTNERCRCAKDRKGAEVLAIHTWDSNTIPHILHILLLSYNHYVPLKMHFVSPMFDVVMCSPSCVLVLVWSELNLGVRLGLMLIYSMTCPIGGALVVEYCTHTYWVRWKLVTGWTPYVEGFGVSMDWNVLEFL